MPMVPETFAPSVAQGDTPMTPATGPWVSPVKNSAPSLLQQTGATLTAAGDTEARLGNTIGDRVQDTMDEALTKSAETSFLKSSQDLLYDPKSGYLNSRGLDAQTQWDPATQAIAKARQDARASLTNPIQQRMFDQVTNDHMLTLGQTMANHQHQQVTQYGIQQSQDRADSMNLLAKSAYLSGNMADYQKYSGQAMDEVLHVASLNGASPDSDIAQAMLRSKRTDLVHGITTGLLDDHKYDQAKQFFSDEQPNIDMRTAEVLNNAVKTEYDRNLTETKGDAFLAAAGSQKQGGGGAVPYTYGPLATGSTINPMKITDVPGTPRPDGRVHDGYDIAMPAGTAVTSPLDGKVVKVWNDDKFGGGLSMRVQLADGNTLGVAHLSATNVNEGDTVNRGQAIALSGKTGNATGPVLHVALQDPDGKNIDYFGASKAQPDQAGVADPDVLQKAIDAAQSDTSLDPFQQKQIVRYMESQHMHERGIQEQQYLEVKQNAVDALMQNGGDYDALPAAIKAQLRPSDQFEFQAKARGITDQERQQAEVPVLANWAENPQQQTPAAVNEAWVKGQLSQSSYLSSLREATKMQADPSFRQQLSVDHDQLTDILAQNQLPQIAFPKDNDDRTNRVALEVAIKNQIALQEQSVKRPLTWQEKGKVARDLIIDKVYTSTPGLMFNRSGTMQPAATLSQADLGNASVYVGSQKVRIGDIPPQQEDRATQALRAEGVQPTQARIAAWWVKAGSPKQ